jgi:hypothetical protein
MLSEEVREAAGHLKETTDANTNTLIKLYTMLVQREIILVDEMNHIKVTRSILRKQMEDAGLDTTVLGDY